MTTLEDLVLQRMFNDAFPPAEVHEEMVDALQEMCRAAALAAQRELLDELSEAVAKRISCAKKTWTVQLADGSVGQMTPKRYAKLQQKSIEQIHNLILKLGDLSKENSDRISKLADRVSALEAA